MRLLLSAYACEPGKGSEQEIGWQRTLAALNEADEVWVLTRSNNRPGLERDPRTHNPRLHFLYYDLPAWMQRWKKKGPALLYVYLFFWQRGAFSVVKEQHRKTPFDAAFHVTFNTMMTGSAMGRLGIPFIIGPVGGGEVSPPALLRSLPFRSRLFETLRGLGVIVQRHGPVTQSAFGKAAKIFLTSKDSFRLLSPRDRARASVKLAVALAQEDLQQPRSERPPVPKFACVGRLLHWKGMHLAIRALARTSDRLPGATLDILGTGPDREWLESVARQEGVADRVRFFGHVDRTASMQHLRTCTALVFPSFHDTGGMAVLESLARGTPVVCLDLGGPGTMVTDACGSKIPAHDRDEEAVVSDLADAIARFSEMQDAEYETYALAARERAAQLTWDKLGREVLEESGLG